MKRLLLVAVVSLAALLPAAPSGAASTGGGNGEGSSNGNGGSSGGSGRTSGQVDSSAGTLNTTGTASGSRSDLALDVEAILGGSNGTAGNDGGQTSTGNSSGGEGTPEPPSYYIHWNVPVFVTPPTCYRTVNEMLVGVTPAYANSLEAAREATFISWFEAYISSTDYVPRPCAATATTPVPALDPQPARDYADDWATTLPVSVPIISGGYAITGLRSWLDLGRDNMFTDSTVIDLGPATLTVTLTAIATTTITWGDGTTTTHTSRGGSYHEGEPSPTDITHTYSDTTDETLVSISDSWAITVQIPGLPDIVFTHTTPTVELRFRVDEVRSRRDS
ncbi:MAG: hypothetical protein ACI970_000283 [Myxococcota bacterium]|jgi:hypothetical protein